MGLKVWLPLNGNLDNLGTARTTITNNGAITDANGKIGMCYTFNGSTGYIALSSQELFQIFTGGTQQFSIAMWVYHADTTRAILFGDFSTSGAINFNIELSTSHGIRFYWAGSPDTSPSNATVAASEWTHVALTYDGTKIQSYINGVAKGSWSGTLGAKNKTSGEFRLGRDNRSDSTAFNGKLNDVRIYDHCLSAAEVHEIAQGLILHYKLDDPYLESSTFIDCNISDSTAYNSSLGKYGYNTTSNLAKTSGIFQGKQCIKISTISEGQSAQPYSYFTNLFTSDGTNQSAYKALSFDYFTTCPTTTWLNIYKLGNGTGTATWKTSSITAGIRTGTYTNSSNSILVQPNEWNHVEVIFHGTTEANAEWGYCVNGPAHTSNLEYYFLFANIQLEANDHVTGYNSAMHNNIIYDNSGYNNNGVMFGTLSINNTAPRYNYSTYFDGSSYILTPANSFGWNDLTQLTISAWMYPTASMTGWRGSVGIAADGTQTSRGIAITDYGNEFRGTYTNGSTYVTIATGKTLTQNEWHHCAGTLNGTTFKLYFDGILVKEQTIDWGTATLNTAARFEVGVDIPGTDEKFTGNYSDVRCYCTTLSAEDIKSLYEASLAVDNKGSLHSYEIQEWQDNIIHKTEVSRTLLKYENGLGETHQSNCQVTLTNNGFRIYRPPNLTTANDGNTMWGGLKIINQTNDVIAVYDSNRDNIWNLQKNHTYIISFHVKGQSSNSCSISLTNFMGWTGGGLSPSPTVIRSEGIPANFQGEKDCFYIFTITDEIVKTCTSSYSSYVAGNQYLSYRHIGFSYGYSSTGELGTDIYITNLRLYDITSHMAEFTKQGLANFYDFIEQMNKCEIRKNSELLSTNFIEF